MNVHFAEVIGHVVAVSAPLLVVSTVSRSSSLKSAPSGESRWLLWATAAAAVTVAALSIAAVPRLADTFFAIAAFVVLFFAGTVPRLHEMEEGARREHGSKLPPQRSASLVRRSASDILPLPTLIFPPAVLLGAAALAVGQLQSSIATWPVRLLAGGFGFAAVVFYFLYQVWIGEEGRGIVRDEHDEGARWRRVRTIAFLQSILVVTFATLSVSLLAFDPLSRAGEILFTIAVAAGAPLGIVGCAYALISGVSPTHLRRGERTWPE